jgi:hypothetical protein
VLFGLDTEFATQFCPSEIQPQVEHFARVGQHTY